MANPGGAHRIHKGTAGQQRLWTELDIDICEHKKICFRRTETTINIRPLLSFMHEGHQYGMVCEPLFQGSRSYRKPCSFTAQGPHLMLQAHKQTH